MPPINVITTRGYCPNPSMNPYDIPVIHVPPKVDCRASTTALFPTKNLDCQEACCRGPKWSVIARENVLAFGSVISDISVISDPCTCTGLCVRISTLDLAVCPSKVQVQVTVKGRGDSDMGSTTRTYSSEIECTGPCKEQTIVVKFTSGSDFVQYNFTNDGAVDSAEATVFIVFG